MAIRRSGNFLGSMRVDIPDLRSIESAITNDFDDLLGKTWAGERALVVRGFTIPVTGTAGNPASHLTLNVNGGILFHYNATAAGTMLVVDSSRTTEALNSSNSRVNGAFVSSALNYVGIDFDRKPNSDTADITKFLNPNTETETERTVPKARILDYTIVISVTPFSFAPNICPVAIIETDASGNVTSITDARNLLFRLGTGGDTPNAFSGYSWHDTARRENPITYTSLVTTDPFSGGDKTILSMKEWMDAVTDTLWMAKSGEHWYSPTNRDTMKVLYAPGPAALLSGDNFTWNAGTGTASWVNVFVTFENASGGYYNTVTDGSFASLANGECLYVDVDRTSVATLVMSRALLTSLSAPSIPGSRLVIAYVYNNNLYVRDRSYEVGRSFTVATPVTSPGGTTGGVLGIVRLSHTAVTPASPIVLSDGARDVAYGVVGLDSQRKATIAAPTGGAAALTVTGATNGDAVFGTGGATSGQGGAFRGGGASALGNTSPNNVLSAVIATGRGTGYGLEAYGGGGNAPGLLAVAGGAGSLGNTTPTDTRSGAITTGRNTGYGLEAYGGPVGGVGVVGVSGDTHSFGVEGLGGNVDGFGVVGFGGGAGGYFQGPGTGGSATDDAIVSKQNIRFSGNSPALTSSTAAPMFSNRLNPLNVAKAWGHVICGGAGVPTLLDGFSCSVERIDNATVRVTMPTMNSLHEWCVVFGNYAFGGAPTWPYLVANTTSTFDVKLYTPGTIIGNNASVHFSFVVFGRT